jgi:hypothetical protein
MCLFTGGATASSFSFEGSFVQDDQLQVFLFSTPSASVLLRTWGYAGGINLNLANIGAGGFDPVLTVFDATGGLGAASAWVASNDDGAVTADPLTGNAFDSLLVLTGLDPSHTYAVVLSQSDNLALGSTYGDGFSQAGVGNFTAGEFGCGGGGPFCDATPAERNGNWAVDISGVRTASEEGAGSVPEPGSMLFLATGMGSLALLRHRGKQT